MKFPRASGILLHPTSLPGRFGIGDIGPQSRSFIDLLAECGQTYWQMLPIGPTGYGDSPYQCFSAFAGSTLLISPEQLAAAGLVPEKVLDAAPEFDRHRVEYGRVLDWKKALLSGAFERFRAGELPEIEQRFAAFVEENRSWLLDYALYIALKTDNGGHPWYEWDAPLKFRDPAALGKASGRLAELVEKELFSQFLFFDQWASLKSYASEHGVLIVGDVPAFAALDSADVWCNQDKFKLNADGSPSVVAGVPPDYFSKTGQLWGNPIFDWEAMRADGFGWWIDRIRRTLDLVDVCRIDHFRGFAAVWEVPGGDETAENGRWVDVPGFDLFSALRDRLGELPLWAEDLGVITPDVTRLRDEFGLPGMKILQYAFGGDANNQDLPHNYHRHTVAYTGTHDNDTAVGWWLSRPGVGSKRAKKSDTHERDMCRKYLNTTGKEINWDMIRAVLASVADTAIIPLQDVLGLGNEARMNLPGSDSGNWTWRFTDDLITDSVRSKLTEMTRIYGRSSLA